MTEPQRHLRILAIDPTSKGFGFAVLENADRLVDWGVARVWARSETEFVARVDAFITRYQPELLVLAEIPSEPRRARSARRTAALSNHVRRLGIPVVVTAPAKLKAVFPGTKQERAEALARKFPDLKLWLPPPRRPWKTEDERMHIFDAVALAIIIIGGE